MAKEKKKEEGFIVHFSTYDTAVEDLTLEQMGELFVKLGRYHFYGEDVSSDDKGVRMVLKMVKPYMKSASERYEEAVKNGMKGKSHGIKGGRPRKGETREEYDARRLERARMLEAGAEPPQKPLNKDINTNTDRDIDIKKEIDIERYKDIDVKKELDINKNIDIKKNANTSVMTNSVYTNQVSFSNSLKPSLDNTKYGVIPIQEPHRNQVFSDESKSYSHSSKDSDSLRSITLEEDLEAPSIPTDERFMNYVGSIQDYFRIGDFNYDEMTDEEMVDAIKEDVDAAIERDYCCQKDQLYQDLIQRAKRTFIRLYRCSEEDAKKSLNRLYQQRKKDYEECP